MDDAPVTVADDGGLTDVLAGRYEVGQILGQGGMGEVRAGRDQRLNREVAIKLLRADMAHQPGVRDRFENEARLAARLVHPHVVAVFDCGEQAGIPFLVMERLSGKTLAHAIATGPLPWADVQVIGLQILDALDAAHAAGLLHRDVKPGNVMAAGLGCWKLGDFGIAKSLEAIDHGLTATGLIVGTASYLPPERLAGGPATISGDLYGAGMVLYEALTGRRRDQAGVPAALSAPFPPVSVLRPDIPAGLAALVTRAMDADPAARFAGAAQMADALRRSTDTGSLDQTVAFAPTPTTTQVMSPPLAGRPDRPRSPVPHRRRRGLTLAALGAVVIIVVSLLLLASDHHRSANPPTTTQSTGVVPAPLDGALRRLEQAVRP